MLSNYAFFTHISKNSLLPVSIVILEQLQKSDTYLYRSLKLSDTACSTKTICSSTPLSFYELVPVLISSHFLQMEYIRANNIISRSLMTYDLRLIDIKKSKIRN